MHCRFRASIQTVSFVELKAVLAVLTLYTMDDPQIGSTSADQTYNITLVE